MNTSVPRSSRDAAARGAARDAERAGGDWREDLADAASRARGGNGEDYAAGMRAIADHLARIEPGGPREAPLGAAPSGAAPSGAVPLGAATLRAAVAEIARRQAVLDDAPVGVDPDPRESDVGRRDAGGTEPVPPRRMASPPEPAQARAAPPPVADETRDRAFGGLMTEERVAQTLPRSGLRRAGIDLSAEVSQTFARFSRDILDAIHAADVRPEIQALDRQVRSIGRTVETLGARNVAPAAPTPSAEAAGTLAEVRGLLESFRPGATISAIETRIDGLAKRLERDGGDPAALIEGLSRRVDEIHQSLRSHFAHSPVDTKPLESLVRDISERIGEARATSGEFEDLQRAMRDVAARIDRAALPADPEIVRGLEAQLAKIGERLERSEANSRAVDGVEHALGELFSQFEVTRQVAIDAAETAARTAARDTLRAALQSPGLQPWSDDASSAVAEQMARGIEDLKAMQEIAQRRTQEGLSQIQDAMDRLGRHLQGVDAMRDVPRTASTPRESRRAETERSRAADAARSAPPPDIDTPIEPGLGRAGGSRTEPHFATEPTREAAPAAPVPAPDADGPASFIAAARRAAQAAQASAASAAAAKAADRKASAPRGRPDAAGGPGALGRAKAFLNQRRRPLLLGLAALVMLVGALEVVNLGLGHGAGERTGMADAAAPERPAPRVAESASAAPAPTQPAAAPVAKPAAADPAPAKSVAQAALPTFVAGPPGGQAAGGGIPEGLKSLAASGDAAAQYEVGLRYAEGRGVARDPKEAAGWFGKAAGQGLAPAEYRLGSAYEKGVGTDRDPMLAMSWYAKAAEAGNVKAMHNLAVMAAEGAAGKPDYAKAAQWFLKASSYGVRDSQYNLAILYARGLGIEQSLAKSYTWFAIAAAAGDEDAGKKRDEVAAKLDPAGLAAAKAAADAFKPAVPPAAANEVNPPAGGWDAAGPKASAAASAKVSRL